jgi:hypothetical protein
MVNRKIPEVVKVLTKDKAAASSGRSRHAIQNPMINIDKWKI